IWAIGPGRPATGAHASAAARGIRAALARAGLDAEAIPILYGGSVSASSVGEFAAAEGIDRALVGGASLGIEEFRAIVSAFR
ncbi:MAG: triose-phosphate isomerase, partial [Chloroflexota bacterium]